MEDLKQTLQAVRVNVSFKEKSENDGQPKYVFTCFHGEEKYLEIEADTVLFEPAVMRAIINLLYWKYDTSGYGYHRV
ncbi:MAG: hypothetical protein ACUVUQ_07500 [Thermodesulfovibrionales bacterium]